MVSMLSTTNPDSANDDSASPLIIGICGTSNSGDPFNGQLDDIRIYNRALSADEIKRLYNLGR